MPQRSPYDLSLEDMAKWLDEIQKQSPFYQWLKGPRGPRPVVLSWVKPEGEPIEHWHVTEYEVPFPVPSPFTEKDILKVRRLTLDDLQAKMVYIDEEDKPEDEI